MVKIGGGGGRRGAENRRSLDTWGPEAGKLGALAPRSSLGPQSSETTLNPPLQMWLLRILLDFSVPPSTPAKWML